MTIWVTGACGLVGSAVVDLLCKQENDVIGIDSDARAEYFGEEATTRQTGVRLLQQYGNFQLANVDVVEIDQIFRNYDKPSAVVHCAAQPSHDKAAEIVQRDFEVNCLATVKLLEGLRKMAPEATMIHMSTNKVYGDAPNEIPLSGMATRWVPTDRFDRFGKGIDESMRVDQSKHSVFGASKLAADIYVQEYGRYFGMNTVALRGGCLTGAAHQGAQLHGFLQYLAKCVYENRPYTIFGYEGKQVRDNIHANDVASICSVLIDNPPEPGTVYNIGGGEDRSCSVLEAINAFETLSGRFLDWKYSEQARSGDHKWYVTDMGKFHRDYPEWEYQYSLNEIYMDILEGLNNG